MGYKDDFKTKLRLTFERWCEDSGLSVEEHYYDCGSQCRIKYPEELWEAWKHSAYLLMATIKNTVECESCVEYCFLDQCPVCKGEKKVLNPLKDFNEEMVQEHGPLF